MLFQMMFIFNIFINTENTKHIGKKACKSAKEARIY